MKILFASSEVFPFSKTGGLADMALFLPKSLKEIGHEVFVITPYYKEIAKHHKEMSYKGTKTISMGGIETIVHYYELIYQDISFIFVQNMHYFERDHFYGYNDDAERFSCFSYSILEAMDVLDFYPNILHLNDWQTGMVPYLLDEHYRRINDGYYAIHTLLTIHNLEYQGSFDPYVSRFFNTNFDYTYMHFDRVNFLKAGISRATKINTVSPTYRNEILTQEFGFTLDGALNDRKCDLVGILNGIDDTVFNPKSDPLIEFNFDKRNFFSMKQKNKENLLKQFNLEVDLNEPLVTYVGRLATQKGINLFNEILEEVIIYSNARFILMGSGNDSYESFFRYLSLKYPKRVSNFIGFNEALAHKVYASSDLFMMPSRFEPCGLGQLIAMRYGALPIVRETGGLKDTVIPFNKFTDIGTGFTFRNYDAFELKEKLFESIQLYKDNLPIFKKLMKQALDQDYSLKQMALSYENLYEIILGV
ncbi:MAG: glycogen synthase [Acholeplasmataceae bacterium]|nr:glycogen synthase [Acholeplasmataceae bacterium]